MLRPMKRSAGRRSRAGRSGGVDFGGSHAGRSARFALASTLVLAAVAWVPLGCSGGSGDDSGGATDGRPERSLDLATIASGANGLLRLHGSSGNGSFGVPVSGGHDLDGDGNNDLALAAMRASPLSRGNAGEVFVLFGDGTISGAIDTAVSQPRVLRIFGAAAFEHAGSEVWIDDVTGDGIADLIIARQNHTPGAGRVGAGAVTILLGGAALADHAATLAPIDLAAPPVGLTLTTFVGAATGDIASDTALQGDFDGDGLPDLAFGSPHGSPYGRSEAGIVHIFHGQSGPFPERIELRWGDQPDAALVRISEVHGVNAGDVLCYSADAGDQDGDGRDDLIVNEMLGDGLSPGTNDVGNLVVVSGERIANLP